MSASGIIMEFWTDSCGMVLAAPRSDSRLAEIKATMKANGAPEDVLMASSTLLSYEDAEAILSTAQIKRLGSFPIRVLMDAWEARHLFGYQSD